MTNLQQELLKIRQLHNASLEQLKPGIDNAVRCLKVCEDFTTDEAKISLQVLQYATDPLICSNPDEVAKYLINEGFGSGQYFSRMWTLLCGYLHTDRWKQSGFEALSFMTGYYMNFTDVCPELGAELGKCGCISLLLEGIKKVKGYLNQEAEFGIIQRLVSDILGILHNSIRLCSDDREFYRNAGAVGILKEYLKQSPVIISTKALMTLAYIVNEEESGILGKSEVGVATIVQLLQQAVKSDNHRAKIYVNLYYYNTFSAFELADSLNHLAINDDNKREIQKHGGVPTITRMLQEDFTEEERCDAAEMLWNLAFIDSIRISEELQDALPGKNT